MTDTPDCQIIQGDSFKLVKDIPEESIQLVLTSPPYNLGKPYEKHASLDSYLTHYEAFAHDLISKLADSGSLCWQVGNYVEKGEVFPLDVFFYRIFKEAGLRLRNRIIWHFGHGYHARRRFSGRYETILWFTKTDDYCYNLDPVRVPAKYPGKRAYKGVNKGEPSGNPLGKNPSDVWQGIMIDEWEGLVWDIPNVKANHLEKTGHPCQFPVELVERCVLALSKPGDLVFDPFLGVGSTAIGAIKRGRRFKGFETDRDYIGIAMKRLEDFRAGTLRLRPMGKPVHQPSGRERVARRPDEWSSLQQQAQ